MHGGGAVPEGGGLGRGFVLVGDVVEGVDAAERAEAAFQVVDDGARHERLSGAVGAEAGPPVNVMVDGGLFGLRVGEV